MRHVWLLSLILISFPSSVFAQATVKGRILFEGIPPSPEKVEVKSDVPTCGSVKEVQKILLGKDQGIANAVVKIVGSSGALVPGKGTLDQVNCDFVPHVQILPAGSTLIITSSDPVLHNSHGFNEDGSTAFNIAVPIMGMEVSKKLEQPGIIKFRCDAGHTWMSAYVIVADEPFYSLTDENGNFELEGLPSGNYQIEIWQEWLGLHREPLEIKGEAEPLTITLRKS